MMYCWYVIIKKLMRELQDERKVPARLTEKYDAL
jgi:hypothetical protein